MKLREYQIDVIEGQLYEELGNGETRVLLVAPTGGGKTVIAAHVIRDAVEDGACVLFVVHLDGLAEQAYERLVGYGLNSNLIGFITGGRKEHRDRPVQICSIQALARRSWWKDTDRFGLTMFDESHITSFAKVSDWFFSPTFSGIVIGLTATPYRLSRRESMLSRGYTRIVQTPPVAALMEMGSLCNIRYFCFPKAGMIDLEGVKTVRGEFDQKELSQRCDRPELLQWCVHQWKRHCEEERRPTLAFCVSIKHAQDLAETFCAGGIPAAYVCADTPRDERSRLYDALDTGDIVVLCAVNVTAIGFDKPCVSCGILARPTQSVSIHIQQVGRMARILEGKKDALILDSCGNVLRHGTLCMQGPWALEPASDAERGEPPLKVCEACGSINRLAAEVCADCGAQFPRKAKPKPRTDDLVEIAQTPRLSKEQRKLKTLVRQANSNAYLPAYADTNFRKLFGFTAPSDMYRAILYPTPDLMYVYHYARSLGRLCSDRDRRFPLAVTSLVREFGSDVVTRHMTPIRQAWSEGFTNPAVPYESAADFLAEQAEAARG